MRTGSRSSSVANMLARSTIAFVRIVDPNVDNRPYPPTRCPWLRPKSTQNPNSTQKWPKAHKPLNAAWERERRAQPRPVRFQNHLDKCHVSHSQVLRSLGSSGLYPMPRSHARFSLTAASIRRS